jgi:iron complex outermembrane recepter protein
MRFGNRRLACLILSAVNCLTGLGLWVAAVDTTACAEPPQTASDTKDITELSVEELMNLTVTSASKKEEPLSKTPAAIFVITSEDIRRGGFTSIPDALRTVPGLFVARINGDWWSVSARGFSDYLNNKMLVLIDGRSVYDPEFGGVEWDQIEVPLEDIDRIEVIRGPGGTLWGANAVNGVINIIAKKAQATQGALVSTSGSPEEGEIASVRYGGKVGENLAYRVFGKSEYWDPGLTPTGTNAFDSWNMSQGGMRLDWQLSSKDDLTIEGRGYDGRVENETPFFSGSGVPESLLFESFVAKGGDFLGRWRHTFSDRSYTEVLGYCDFTDRTGVFYESRNTCDVEFEHNYAFGKRHSIVWGGSVSTSGSYKPPFFGSTFTPAQRQDTVVSAFGQYEISVVPDRLSITGGAKFEHNPFTGFEIEPQIRGVWTPSKAHSIWAAVSRGVRVPAESEADSSTVLAQEPGAVPTYVVTVGNPNLKAEVMRAYEAGYRFQPNRFFALDADIFYNHYDNLINLDLVHIGAGGPPIVHQNPEFVEIPVPWQNIGPGQSHGAEVYARIRPVNQWEMDVGVTELRGNSANLGDSLNVPLENTPRHQFNVQSRLDLTRHLSLDSVLYYTGGIPLDVQAVISQDVRTHFREDVGMSWHEASGFTLSVWGRDLGTASRPESLPALFTTTASYVQRSVGISLLWQSKPDKAAPKQ